MAETAAKLELVATVRDQMTRTFRTMQTGATNFVDAIRSKFKQWASDLFGIRGLLAGVAAFLGGRALIASARSIAEVAAETSRWADRLGIAVEQLDQLEFVGRKFGVGADQLRDGLKTLQEKLSDAAEGSASLRKRLDDLGVSGFDPVTGRVRNAVDMLEDLAVAYRRLREDGRGADLGKISADLFGGAAPGLQGLLQRGPYAIRIAADLADQVGLMTRTQARAAELVANAFELADRAVRNLKLAMLEAFGADIIAALRTFAALIADNRTEIVQFVRDVAALAVTALKTVAQITITIVRGILDAIDFVRNSLGKVQDVLTTGFDLFTAGPYAAASRADQRKSSATDEARTQLDALQDQAGSAAATFESFLTRYAERFGEFRTAAQADMREVMVTATQAAEGTSGAWDAYFDGFEEGFGQWKREILEFRTTGVAAGRETFQAVQNGLTTFIDTAIKGTEKFRDAWKTMLRSILDDWIATFSKIASQSLLSGIFGSLFSGVGGGGPLTPGGRRGPPSGLIPGGGGGISSLGSGGGGGVVQHITIQAVDPRSFADLLRQNPGTISSMVVDLARGNQAVKTVLRRR